MTALRALVALLACSGSIVEWRTPGGALYFGDRPPAGSTKVGVFEDAAPPGAEISPADGGLSVRASLERHRIEVEMSAAAEDLARVRAQIDALRRRPKPKIGKRARGLLVLGDDGVARKPSQAARDDAERLERLGKEERADLAEITRLRHELGALASEVKREYGGTPPWWRDAVDCPRCPAGKSVRKRGSISSRRKARAPR